MSQFVVGIMLREGTITGQPPNTNRPKLTLHVPEPPYRPGDAVDYSWLEIPAPDAIPRPDEAADPAAITASSMATMPPCSCRRSCGGSKFLR